MGIIKFLFILLLISGCNFGKIGTITGPNINSGGIATGGSPFITSVTISNNQIVVNGSNLDNVTIAKMSGDATHTFAIESKTFTELVLNAKSALGLVVDGTFDLIISNAYGAATFPITVVLQDGQVTAAKLNSMGATSGQVLRYNGTSWGPASISASQIYSGTYNANTNSPDIAALGGPAGTFYIVTTAGSQNLGSGVINFAVGDWAIYDGTNWSRVPLSGNTVSSFKGRTGVVVPLADDYSWGMLQKTSGKLTGSKLSDIADVDVTGIADGMVLKWQTNKWVASVEDNAVAPNSITSAEIVNGAVSTAKIANSAVDGTKLATSSVDSTKITDNSIVNADISATADIAQSKILNLTTDLNGKEGTITAGTTAQYFRGDKTWATLSTTNVPEGTNLYFLDARVRGALMAGYATGSALPLSASDTLIQALGKLEGNINSLSSDGRWTKSGSNISYSAGNVGIGGTATTNKLEVYGSGFFQGALGAQYIYAQNLPSHYQVVNNGVANHWTRIANIRFNADYNLFTTQFMVTSGNVSARGLNGIIYFRAKLNGTMAAATPVANVEVDSSNTTLLAADVVAVLTQNTATLKEIGLYVRLKQNYDTLAYTPIATQMYAENVDFQPTALAPSLPAGTQTAAVAGMTNWLLGSGNTLTYGAGSVGVGDNPTPFGTFDVSKTYTQTSGGNFNLYAQATANPSAASSGSYYNYIGSGTQSGNTRNITGAVTGLYVDGNAEGTGTVNQLVGVGATTAKKSTGVVSTAMGLYSIVKNSNATGAITNGYGLYIDSFVRTGAITNSWGVYVADTTAYNFFGGNVGINAVPSTATEKLSVGGNSRFAGTINAYNGSTLSFTDNGIDRTTTMSHFNDADFRITSTLGDINLMPQGNVGIGVTTPQTKLAVNGVIAPSVDNNFTLGSSSYRFTNIYASGSIIATSDERQKKNIKDSDLGLSFINRLRPVSYNWKTGDKEPHYGLIAQETKKAIAESRRSPAGNVIVDYDSNSDRFGVKYMELISPIIKAIQEFYAEFLDSKKDIAALRKENDRLAKENAQIKEYLCHKDPAAPICK